MATNTSKSTITQDSLSGISRNAAVRVQNSLENISSCAPNIKSVSGISPSIPTTSNTNVSSTYRPTGTISSCAPKSNK